MKVVGIVFAGRTRYLQCLVPYLLRDARLFDHIELWDNTSLEDRGYAHALAIEYPHLFKVINLGDGYIIDRQDFDHKVANLHLFFKRGLDKDTLYIKLDDDIVWIAPGAIEGLIRYRQAHPEWWMVVGNTINNTACRLLHTDGEIPLSWENEYQDGVYKSSTMANACHEEFFRRLKTKTLEDYDFGVWDSVRPRQIPNQAYAFLGEDWVLHGGNSGPDEYKHYGETIPQALGRRHCIYGPSLFVHYSYRPQEPGVDPKHLLAYQALAGEV